MFRAHGAVTGGHLQATRLRPRRPIYCDVHTGIGSSTRERHGLDRDVSGRISSYQTITEIQVIPKYVSLNPSYTYQLVRCTSMIWGNYTSSIIAHRLGRDWTLPWMELPPRAIYRGIDHGKRRRPRQVADASQLEPSSGRACLKLAVPRASRAELNAPTSHKTKLGPGFALARCSLAGSPSLRAQVTAMWASTWVVTVGRRGRRWRRSDEVGSLPSV